MMMTAMQDILQCLQMERGQWVSRNINKEGGRGNLLQRGEFSTFYFLLHTTGGPEGSSLQVENLSLSVIALTFPLETFQSSIYPRIMSDPTYHTSLERGWPPDHLTTPTTLTNTTTPTSSTYTTTQHIHILSFFQGSMLHCQSTRNFSFFTFNCAVPESQIKSATVTEQTRAYFRSAIGAEMGAQSTLCNAMNGECWDKKASLKEN